MNSTSNMVNYSKIGTIIFYTIIYIPGFIGNILSLLTFSTGPMRKVSSGIFLLILSISDTLALMTTLWYLLSDVFQIELSTYSALGCRFRHFFAAVFMDTSSWCLTALSFDRFLKTQLPIRSKSISTPKNALISIMIIFILLCGLNSHLFSAGMGQERDKNTTLAHCRDNKDDYPQYYHFKKLIWPNIDMIIFCLLPALIMIISNIKIIHNIKRQRRNVDTNNGNNKKKKFMENQMMFMMFACVVLFIITTFPLTIYLVLLERTIGHYNNYYRDRQYWQFILRMLRLLNYLHFGVNFYLYCLTSQLFRQEFIRVITWGRRNKRKWTSTE
ncbi:unnamed protein product [Didymodactylos carnosus]|uniref:G-protein coupled receptors family 1 profile domain-containing protein n=1 Tax=Didymodactylos carnosus TaxID=1234261 RepID=A0A814J6U3_9BILA|nr:unnamed protein product [Didymodactylos carnosus]CAF1035340.1 unnamed protein product [Didymodactylos carnosus]CAF3649408.1 unnamed protein product [Didymodactylos carnosus]CAF3805969.1 unnamed protein product [Didymodactylos carnosus]